MDEKDDEEAIKLFKKSISQGYEDGIVFHNLCSILCKKRRFEEAYPFLLTGAEKNEELYLEYLGRMHFFGDYVDKYFSKARKFLQKAADLGDLDAVNFMKENSKLLKI